VEYNHFDDNLRYALDLGIIRKSEAGIRIAKDIYKEIIPRVFDRRFVANMLPKISPQWFIKPDGRLDMDGLLPEFQDFYREHSVRWLHGFSFQDIAKQLILMALLQRILIVGGPLPVKWP